MSQAKSDKEIEADCHNHHSGNQTDDREVMLPVLFGTWKQFIQRYVDHYSGNYGQNKCIEHRVPEPDQEEVGDNGSYRFSQPRRKESQNAFFLLPVA